MNATREQMDENCRIATEFTRELRKNYPKTKFHLPADYEVWVQMAWLCDIISEEQILRVDCEILSECKGMIVFAPDGYISRGMQVEIDWAEDKGIPYIIVDHSIHEKERIDDFLYFEGE